MDVRGDPGTRRSNSDTLGLACLAVATCSSTTRGVDALCVVRRLGRRAWSFIASALSFPATFVFWATAGMICLIVLLAVEPLITED